MIRDRLLREVEGNVAIKVPETDGADAYEVAGRGELQLGMLIETMRREGFELSISRPRVLFKNDPATASAWSRSRKSRSTSTRNISGSVVEKVGERKGDLTDMRPSGGGKSR